MIKLYDEAAIAYFAVRTIGIRLLKVMEGIIGAQALIND